MSTDASYAEFVVDQAGPRLGVRVGKMFGEYALYVDEKVVAFLCDNRTLIKPTDAGRAFFDEPEIGHPYPGAKDYWIADEVVEDAPRFQELLRATANELPAPKPRKAKSAKATSAAMLPEPANDERSEVASTSPNAPRRKPPR